MRFIISFLLLSITIQAQVEIPKDSIQKNQLFVTADVFGVTLLPLTVGLSENVTSHNRFLGKVQYIMNEKIAFDIGYGQDHLESNFDLDDLILTSFDSNYMQFYLNYLPYNQKKARVFIGGGFLFGRFSQKGFRFDNPDGISDFDKPESFDEKFKGWSAGLSLDYKFNSRWSIELYSRIQGTFVNNKHEAPIIYYNPSGGSALLPLEGASFGFHRTLWIKYRIF